MDARHLARSLRRRSWLRKPLRRRRSLRLYWANSNDGLLVVPQIGQFKDGVGEFYAQDILNGKSILIRFIWSKTNSDTPHFEQSFSADGGKTWEVNWISESSR